MGLASDSSGSAGGVRGAARRERMQETLRNRSGSFSEQVNEIMFRRMGRTAGLQADPLLYLERFGGYAALPEYGLLVWLMGSILGHAWGNDIERVRDEAALALVALEQANLDDGRWDLAWMLTLQEDVPAGVFTRPRSQGPGGRAFAPLAAQHWTTTALAYLREIDTLQTRRSELRARGGGRGRRGGRFPTPGANQHATEDGEQGEAGETAPRRRSRGRR